MEIEHEQQKGMKKKCNILFIHVFWKYKPNNIIYTIPRLNPKK